ncbi:MAG TPA: decaprenyl-phosphate phosphoribosyltransferase, partial [Candidatus Angelobacter sp.]|nr:decaprenyl-phosphate phosphoribosyltransferase [Candidatus Angelobacter sp.]
MADLLATGTGGYGDTTVPRRPRPLPLAILVALRPRQWVKNLLVYAVPLAAGKLTERDVLVDTTIAFLAFCAVASATYLVNDARDV